jgi:hypothetical protein
VSVKVSAVTAGGAIAVMSLITTPFGAEANDGDADAAVACTRTDVEARVDREADQRR